MSASWLPTIWGVNASAAPGGVLGGCSGHMFAFSGLDGNTSETADFVGVFELAGPASFALRFCATSGQPVLQFSLPGPIADVNVTAATGDVLNISSAGGGALLMAWASGKLLVGALPPGASVQLNASEAYMGPAGPTGVACRVLKGRPAVALCTSPVVAGEPWGLAYSADGADAAVAAAAVAACAPAGAGCNFSLPAVVGARLRAYTRAPPPRVAAPYLPLVGKALSVMRVNALAPEGLIEQRWSTPDRTPHRWMWLWDSCYHSFAANLMAGERHGHTLGWEYVQSVLLGADPAGAIAIERTPTSIGKTVTQTQPPLLAWAVHENYEAARAAGDGAAALERLRWAVPRLEAYLRWDFSRRADPTGRTPLLCWSQGTESGMDNSPRFDLPRSPPRMLAVDFSVFAARESAHLATLHAALGHADAAREWRAVAANLSSAIHAELWDPSRRLYFDKDAGDGTFSAVAAVTGLLPLWLSDLPSPRLPQLLAAIADPARFGTAAPLPSVARSTPSFSTDMWRGPMWLNTNYHIVLALLTHNQSAAARRLVRATLDVVRRGYEQHGVLFEFYDADGTHDPRTLLRKGARTGGVRDYHWTAALTYVMALLEPTIGPGGT